MDRSTRFALTGVLVLALGLALGAPAAADDPYQQWIAAHTRRFMTFSGAPSLLTIQEFHGRSTEGCQVGQDGSLSSFEMGEFGSHGGGGNTLSPEELKTLQGLLAQLPDDRAQVPPEDRGLMVQASVNGQMVTRVYDRANAPDVVWKIARLAQCNIGPWLQEFRPQSEIDVFGAEPDGDFSLAPDGKEMLFGLCNSARYQLWDTTAHEFLAQLPGDVLASSNSSSAFNPRGDLVVICDRDDNQTVCVETRTGTVVHKLASGPAYGNGDRRTSPQFTPDGRCLMLLLNNTRAEFYDTATWKPMAAPPEFPADTLRYFPSTHADHAAVLTQTGELELWNPVTHAKVATLKTNLRLGMAAFSPDGTLVATATLQDKPSGDDALISIWDTATGARTRAVSLANYTQTFGRGSFLTWSPDGKYLFATVSSGYHSSALVIFNAQTGRPRGYLVGGPPRIVGLGLLPNGQVVAGGEDGKIRFWDLTAALQQIEAFEATLPK